MFILYPHADFHRIHDIPDHYFSERGITTLLLDIDNTLTHDNNPDPDPVVMAWLEQQRAAGMRLMLLSNNRASRVKAFAERLGMEYIAEAGKPDTKHLRRALDGLGVTTKEAAIIGDQIFTDILCGRLAGCLTILVEPMEIENYGGYIIKRRLELPVLRAYRRKMRKQK